MKSMSRILRRERPNDAIAPSAIPAPRRAPSWPRPDDSDRTWWNLPPENPELLSADPAPAEPYGARHRRPSCLLLGASRAEHEHLRQLAATADAIGYELAVAEAMLLLYPDNADAAAISDVLHAALPVVCDRKAMPLAVTR